MGDLFGSGQGRYTFRKFGKGSGMTRGPVLREWKKNHIDMTANVVCEPCNTRWMSVIESTHAKPTLKHLILSGNPVTLLPVGVESIARFMFLKAVVADHMNSTRRAPFFTRSQRSGFRQDHLIPNGVQMWIGRFRDRGRRGNFSTYYLTVTGGPFAGFEFYVFTYIINYVALQLTARRWPSLIANPPTTIPYLRQHEVWDEAATEMWPDGIQPLSWPPPKTIGGDVLDDFTFRWMRLNSHV